jgi:hypothetical protein
MLVRTTQVSYSKLNRQQAQSNFSGDNLPSGYPGTKEYDPMHRLIELAEYESSRDA